MTIGERIRELRKSKGFSQKYLGELSGTAENTIRQYENNKRTPRIEQIEKIANALEVKPHQLMSIEWDNEYPNVSKEVNELEKFIYYLKSLDYIVDIIQTGAESCEFAIIKEGKTVTFNQNEFMELQNSTREVIETKFYKKLIHS